MRRSSEYLEEGYMYGVSYRVQNLTVSKIPKGSLGSCTGRWHKHNETRRLAE
jgi:hypothetical protein